MRKFIARAFTLGVFTLIITVASAQQPATGSPPLNTTITQASAGWFRGGNNTSTGNNNIFGTLWNSPIYTRTNSLNRTKLNGNLSYTINGYSASRDGYMLIGFDRPFQGTTENIYTTRGAYSLLHLNGRGNEVQQYGYRPWMETGMTLTDNYDLSYLGLRKLSTNPTEVDITETVLAWSDNSTSSYGPDKMVFRFFGFGGSDGSAVTNNYNSNTDLDGLHVAQFTGTGTMGLGNTFGTNATGMNVGYIEPQSLYHQSYTYDPSAARNLYGYMQITLAGTGSGAGAAGTGQSLNDGLRWGIDNVQVNGGLPAFLRWQEATPFIMQTDWNNTAGGIQDGERFRVTATGMAGVPASPLLKTNLTRIGIAGEGISPVTQPISMVHMGSNVTYSYANWMEYGTLVANPNRTLFTGITNNVAADRDCPVIGFGGNNLLFLHAIKGEMARIQESTGNMGIGNFGTAGLATAPSERIDVDGSARFRKVEAEATPTALFVGEINGTNSKDLTLKRLDFPGDSTVTLLGNGTFGYATGLSGAHNGTSKSTIDVSKVALGQDAGAGANGPGALLSTREIPLNNFNIAFTNSNAAAGTTNRFGIGTISPLAKLDVDMRSDFNSANKIGFQITVPNNNTNGQATAQQISVYQKGKVSIGNNVYVKDADLNMGAYYFVTGGSTTEGINIYNGFGSNSNTAIRFESQSLSSAPAPVNYGIRGRAINGKQSVGGHFSALSTNSTLTDENTAVYGFAQGAKVNKGLWGRVSSSNTENYGVYGQATLGTQNWAGYFAGKVHATMGYTQGSDQMFKTNVTVLNSSLKRLSLVKPHSYFLDTANYQRFGFESTEQFGFIAQELEQVYPNLVTTATLPAEYDSLGVEIAPAVTYKTLNYIGLIPVNTQAIIELNQKVDKQSLSDQTIKTNVQNLNGSLDKVLAMRGVSYDWNHAVHPELNLDSANHVGFIAQEVQQIDSRLTFTGDDNLLHVEYDKVVPMLAEAVQELNEEVESKDSVIASLVAENSAQQSTIDNLNARLSQLENCLSAILPTLCQMNQQAVQSNDSKTQEQIRAKLAVTLSNKDAIILDQNIPNPFAEQTVINFSIPATVGKAQIHFYNGEGRLIQTVEVKERGLGSLTVFGSDLSSGIYTYTLVADGQIVATKKMMKE